MTSDGSTLDVGHLLRPAQTPLAWLVAVCLVVTATYVAQGILIARVFGDVIAGASVASVLPALGGVGVAQVIRSVAMVVREVQGARTASAIKDDLRDRLYRHLLRLGPGEARRRRTGELQSVLVDMVETVEPFVARFVPQAVASIVGAVAIAAYLISLDRVVGLVVLGCAAVVPWVPVASRRLVDRRMQPWWQGYRDLYAENLDAVQGMTTLKLCDAAGRRGRELQVRAEEFCHDSIRICAIVVVYVGVVAAFVGIGTALAVGIGALRTAQGLLPAGDLLIILLLTRECFRPLRQLQEAYHSAASTHRALAAMSDLLDTPDRVGDPASPTTPPPTTCPSITFDRVEFTYPDRDQPALRALDLHVSAGEHVALVGRSGAGKTTLVSLLLRWYDPQVGRVSIDGTDSRDLALADLRDLVALVSQDTYLFHGTVRDNVTLARPDVADHDVHAVLATARATFVRDLPQGLATVIGERGMKLSGGERQRLAIARALLADAPILVLDEATSNLDAANETSLTAALDDLARGRTTITIAHRLSTVRGADRIVVIDDGRVVESGTHDDLVGADGQFARLAAAGRETS